MRFKNLLLVIIMLVANQAFAQNTLIDRNGIASFFSEAPVEDIEAVNKEALGAIGLEKGTLAVSMFMTGFHFHKSLMEEHFNENYIESEKFPKATFKGKIINYSNYDLTKAGDYEVDVEGDLDIHGVIRPLNTKAKFSVSESEITVKTFFEISISDHDIEIPTLVIKNIAEVVEVKASFKFTK